MVFGQLTSRDSMRDLLLSLEAHKSKYYHLGFGSTVSRRNFGSANEKLSYKIFEEFAYVLIEEAHKSCYRSDFEINVEGNVYAFDSSTIDLCLSVFWWAEFRKTKGALSCTLCMMLKHQYLRSCISKMPRCTMSMLLI